MNNNAIDFGAGWSPSNSSNSIKKPRTSTRVSFGDKFEDTVARKDYEALKELIKDPLLKKSKQQKIAIGAILSHFDAQLFQITQKPLELGLNHIFRAIKTTPALLLDDAVISLIEDQKLLKHNSWWWDKENSVYLEIYENFLASYMEGDHTLLPVIKKIQLIDPVVLNNVNDLSETIFSPMTSVATQFLLNFPVNSWRKTVESFDNRTTQLTSDDLLKIQNSLHAFPKLHTAFQEFYADQSQKHQMFLDFFNENIGLGTKKECVLQNKIRDKTVKIKDQYQQYKSLSALCDEVLPYTNNIKKLGLSDAQTFLYTTYSTYHDFIWNENGKENAPIFNPRYPNFLSTLIGFGAPALELAFQTQQGIDAVQECLKDDYTRAMFAINASVPMIKMALTLIPSLNQFKDGFENGIDHFMSLRKDQNKQVVECVAQHFSNNSNVFGKSFGGVYEYIQSPAKANEYQKLLLKNLVKKDEGVLKKMRSRSTLKRKM